MDTKTYVDRRKTLRGTVGGGAILLLGQEETSRNQARRGQVPLPLLALAVVLVVLIGVLLRRRKQPLE